MNKDFRKELKVKVPYMDFLTTDNIITSYVNDIISKKGYKICNIDIDFYTTRERSIDEILPWDTIDVGVSKKFLKLERKRAYGETVTPDCRHGCAGCGANCLLKEVACDA